MSSIFALPDNIKRELSVDEPGKAYATQSGVARLCGVSQSAINQLLEQRFNNAKLFEKFCYFYWDTYY